jgi:hypothetical protein
VNYLFNGDFFIEARPVVVHLKSFCHGYGLIPVLDEDEDGDARPNRYACRTAFAQALILENWIEQQVSLGRSVIVLGDFNRRLNRVFGSDRKPDHFWQTVNDGTPNGLQLQKGPLGENTECWARPHSLFHKDHIEFIVFDNSLDGLLTAEAIKKVALPKQNEERYGGKNGERLSDHCPVITEIVTQ